MPINIGSNSVDKAYAGSVRVNQMYVGNQPLLSGPPVTSGLFGWWDESSLASATNWRNRVGDARLDLTDTNNAAGLRIDQINGLPALQNTQDAYLRSASPVDVLTPVTMFIVIRTDRLLPSNWPGSEREFFVDSHSTGNERLNINHGNDLNGRVGLRYSGSSSGSGVSYDGLGPRQRLMPLVFTVKTDTISSFRVSGLGQETLPGVNVPIRLFRLFSDVASARYSRATIGEILFYDRGLTDQERTSVEGYLEAKWGVTYPITDAVQPDAWYSDATIPGGPAQVVNAWPNNYQLSNQWDLFEGGVAGGFRTFEVNASLMVIDSTGAGHLETALSIPQTVPFTFVGVIRPNSDAGQMMWNDAFDASPRVIQFYNGSIPEWSMNRERTTGTSVIAGGDTNRRVVSFAYSGSGDNISRVGGHGQAIDVGDDAASTVNMMRLYSDVAGGRRFIGRVMEFAYWNRRLTDQQVLDIEAFLRTKWQGT